MGTIGAERPRFIPARTKSSLFRHCNFNADIATAQQDRRLCLVFGVFLDSFIHSRYPTRRMDRCCVISHQSVVERRGKGGRENTP
mmetsp:Transcript_26089/g.48657  ORF Transcript_26089/g.48657 Transcript_26089/m.48657 type:complete len:85 (+) Transcript_26089:140-394(+)